MARGARFSLGLGMLTRPVRGARSGHNHAVTIAHTAELSKFTNQNDGQFHTKTVDVCIWLAGLIRVFWTVRPRTTAIVIAATVMASCTSLAAFLLPLKVLLLAGSASV